MGKISQVMTCVETSPIKVEQAQGAAIVLTEPTRTSITATSKAEKFRPHDDRYEIAEASDFLLGMAVGTCPFGGPQVLAACLGVVALTKCVPDDSEPLPGLSEDNGDGGLSDVSTLSDASEVDAGEPVIDASSVDGNISIDANLADVNQSIDSGASSAPDATVQTDGGTTSAPIPLVSCKIVDTTRPRALSGARITNETLAGGRAPLTSNTNMLFSSPQSDPAMVEARRRGPASSWPQDGQVINPTYQNLLASYRLEKSASQLVMRGAQGNPFIIPMTRLNGFGEPQAIARDTSNERYPQFSGSVSVPIQSNVCPTGEFGGEALSVTNSVNNAVTSLMMCCKETQ